MPGVNDDDDYLRAWAKNVAKAVSRAELQALIRQYRRLSRNMRIGRDDRAIARRRARALAEFMK